MNILQSHGFPKIMGVLTHLDSFKDGKKLKTTKKRLKHRFWTEIYQGAKLFYLSGLINGKYPKNEIVNLARFISIIKFRPIIWRNTHPYLVIDRVEDVTDPELISNNPKSDRTVTLYGYTRGTNLKSGIKCHIPGVGDSIIHSVEALSDPCPLPDKVKKSLSEKQKVIYAPMSDVAGIMYDKDAVYVNVRSNFNRDVGEIKSSGENMVINLAESKKTFNDQIDDSEMKIFSSSEPLKAKDLSLYKIQVDEETSRRKIVFDDDDQDFDDDESDDEEDADMDDQDLDNDSGSDSQDEIDQDSDEEQESDDESTHKRQKVDKDFKYSQIAEVESGKKSIRHKKNIDIAFADSDDDFETDFENSSMLQKLNGNELFGDDIIEDQQLEQLEEGDYIENDEEIDLEWKSNMASRASTNFIESKIASRRRNLMYLVYGDETNPAPALEEDSESEQEEDQIDGLFKVKKQKQQKWSLKMVDTSKVEVSHDDLELEWIDDDALDSIRHRFITGNNEEQAVQDEQYGDFEDLESGEKFQPDAENSNDLETKKQILKRKFDAAYDSESGSDNGLNSSNIYERTRAEFAQQSHYNSKEFEDLDPALRINLEGHRPGTYVRILIHNITPEFIDNFNPKYPVILGGVNSNEDSFGFIQVRVKRHRWYKKTLKTNDPIIMSVGWRRFQTMPMYSLDDGTRNRVLKYTPEHMHCLATLYGPITPPNTGFCAFQAVSEGTVCSFLI